MIVKPSLDQAEIRVQPNSRGGEPAKAWFDDVMEGLARGIAGPKKSDGQTANMQHS